MSFNINIENYESFYLDYLEGTLSPEAIEAFERFLSEHPELAVDGELFQLDALEEIMDPFEKELMKKDLGEITAANLELAMIAHTENQLSETQTHAMMELVQSNPITQATLVAYERAHMVADTSLVMDKSSLYQKERTLIIRPWFYRSIAAAAVLTIAIVLLNQETGSKKVNNTNTFASNGENDTLIQNKNTKLRNSIAENSGTDKTFKSDQAPHNAVSTFANNKSSDNKTQSNSHSDTKEEQKGQENNIKTHSPTILPDLKENKAVAVTKVEEENKTNNQDVALANKTDKSVTPLEFIKNKVSDQVDKLNTPVEIKSTKSASNEKNGFVVRIGKFELSHKKGNR